MAEEESARRANILLGEAVLLRARRSREEAIAKCQEALKLLPENPEAFEILGDLYAEGSLWEAALEAYRRALDLAPSRGNLETKIARVVLQKDKTDQQRRLARDLLEGRIPRTRNRSPATAGLLSLLLPGLGQGYNHEWLKAAAIMCLYVFFSMAAIAGTLRVLLSQRASSGPPTLNLFPSIGAFLAPPALWWTLLLALLYIYSAIDAAVRATRSEADETGLI